MNCDIIVGYKSVYRMCFAMACFFFLFSIIMIRVRTSKDPRAAIQNGWGCVRQCCSLVATQRRCAWRNNVYSKEHLCLRRFWFFKFLLLVGITVGAFYIPDGSFNMGMSSSWSTIALEIHFEQILSICFLEAENDQIFVLKYVLYFHSVVLLWRGGLLRLHHHPAHPADRLCSFLEPVLAGEGRKRKPQVLVWR